MFPKYVTLDLFKETTIGSELYIVFDKCCGQNKNNTVLRLAAWITKLGYFNEVNFIFLIVGHTKNAADCLFNSLKVKFGKMNLYTFDQLVEALGTSRTITIHPTVSEDFFDYGKLLISFINHLQVRLSRITSSLQ